MRNEKYAIFVSRGALFVKLLVSLFFESGREGVVVYVVHVSLGFENQCLMNLPASASHFNIVSLSSSFYRFYRFYLLPAKSRDETKQQNRSKNFERKERDEKVRGIKGQKKKK